MRSFNLSDHPIIITKNVTLDISYEVFMNQPLTTFQQKWATLQNRVAEANSETAEKKAVMDYLRKDLGYTKTRSSVISDRTPDKRHVRIYLWRDTPIGSIALVTGPSINAEVHFMVHPNLAVEAVSSIPATKLWLPKSGQRPSLMAVPVPTRLHGSQHSKAMSRHNEAKPKFPKKSKPKTRKNNPFKTKPKATRKARSPRVSLYPQKRNPNGKRTQVKDLLSFVSPLFPNEAPLPSVLFLSKINSGSVVLQDLSTFKNEVNQQLIVYLISTKQMGKYLLAFKYTKNIGTPLFDVMIVDYKANKAVVWKEESPLSSQSFAMLFNGSNKESLEIISYINEATQDNLDAIFQSKFQFDVDEMELKSPELNKEIKKVLREESQSLVVPESSSLDNDTSVDNIIRSSIEEEIDNTEDAILPEEKEAIEELAEEMIEENPALTEAIVKADSEEITITEVKAVPYPEQPTHVYYNQPKSSSSPVAKYIKHSLKEHLQSTLGTSVKISVQMNKSKGSIPFKNKSVEQGGGKGLTGAQGYKISLGSGISALELFEIYKKLRLMGFQSAFWFTSDFTKFAKPEFYTDLKQALEYFIKLKSYAGLSRSINNFYNKIVVLKEADKISAGEELIVLPLEFKGINRPVVVDFADELDEMTAEAVFGSKEISEPVQTSIEEPKPLSEAELDDLVKQVESKEDPVNMGKSLELNALVHQAGLTIGADYTAEKLNYILQNLSQSRQKVQLLFSATNAFNEYESRYMFLELNPDDNEGGYSAILFNDRTPPFQHFESNDSDNFDDLEYLLYGFEGDEVIEFLATYYPYRNSPPSLAMLSDVQLEGKAQLVSKDSYSQAITDILNAAPVAERKPKARVKREKQAELSSPYDPVMLELIQEGIEKSYKKFFKSYPAVTSGGKPLSSTYPLFHYIFGYGKGYEKPINIMGGRVAFMEIESDNNSISFPYKTYLPSIRQPSTLLDISLETIAFLLAQKLSHWIYIKKSNLTVGMDIYEIPQVALYSSGKGTEASILETVYTNVEDRPNQTMQIVEATGEDIKLVGNGWRCKKGTPDLWLYDEDNPVLSLSLEYVSSGVNDDLRITLTKFIKSGEYGGKEIIINSLNNLMNVANSRDYEFDSYLNLLIIQIMMDIADLSKTNAFNAQQFSIHFNKGAVELLGANEYATTALKTNKAPNYIASKYELWFDSLCSYRKNQAGQNIRSPYPDPLNIIDCFKISSSQKNDILAFEGKYFCKLPLVNNADSSTDFGDFLFGMAIFKQAKQQIEERKAEKVPEPVPAVPIQSKTESHAEKADKIRDYWLTLFEDEKLLLVHHKKAPYYEMSTEELQKALGWSPELIDANQLAKQVENYYFLSFFKALDHFIAAKPHIIEEGKPKYDYSHTKDFFFNFNLILLLKSLRPDAFKKLNKTLNTFDGWLIDQNKKIQLWWDQWMAHGGGYEELEKIRQEYKSAKTAPSQENNWEQKWKPYYLDMDTEKIVPLNKLAEHWRDKFGSNLSDNAFNGVKTTYFEDLEDAIEEYKEGKKNNHPEDLVSMMSFFANTKIHQPKRWSREDEKLTQNLLSNNKEFFDAILKEAYPAETKSKATVAQAPVQEPAKAPLVEEGKYPLFKGFQSRIYACPARIPTFGRLKGFSQGNTAVEVYLTPPQYVSWWTIPFALGLDSFKYQGDHTICPYISGGSNPKKVARVSLDMKPISGLEHSDTDQAKLMIQDFKQYKDMFENLKTQNWFFSTHIKQDLDEILTLTSLNSAHPEFLDHAPFDPLVMIKANLFAFTTTGHTGLYPQSFINPENYNGQYNKPNDAISFFFPNFYTDYMSIEDKKVKAKFSPYPDMLELEYAEDYNSEWEKPEYIYWSNQHEIYFDVVGGRLPFVNKSIAAEYTKDCQSSCVLIKDYSNRFGQAFCEVLAAQISRFCGIAAPDMIMGSGKNIKSLGFNGNAFVISPIVEDVIEINKALHFEKLGGEKGFNLSAHQLANAYNVIFTTLWLGNWDFYGLSGDNIFLTHQHNLSLAYYSKIFTPIDLGACLAYRAQGEIKKDWFEHVKVFTASGFEPSKDNTADEIASKFFQGSTGKQMISFIKAIKPYASAMQEFAAKDTGYLEGKTPKQYVRALIEEAFSRLAPSIGLYPLMSLNMQNIKNAYNQIPQNLTPLDQIICSHLQQIATMEDPKAWRNHLLNIFKPAADKVELTSVNNPNEFNYKMWLIMRTYLNNRLAGFYYIQDNIISTYLEILF